MSRDLPWYKRDVDAWRGGTRGMNMELRGFYSECLDAMWDIQGPIPSDEKKLAMMFCCSPRTVRKLLPKLVSMGKLIEVQNGYINRRMASDIGIDWSPVQVEFDANSTRIQREFDAKVPKNPMFSTRDSKRKKEDIEEEPRNAGAREGISFEEGRVEISEDVAADLAIDFPKAVLAEVAVMAAPDLVRFRHPSASDKLAVIRKHALLNHRANSRQSVRGQPAPGQPSALDIIRSMRREQPTA